MKEFTQTALAPVGNCWQTAIACLLEVDPGQLPDQATNDYKLVDGQWVGRSYNNVLQQYLRTHHGLVYLELQTPKEGLAMLAIKDPGWHIITGRTVRTDERGIRHSVVGRYGEVAWDPHPSRAGLTDDIRWALLAPRPKEWEEHAHHLGPCACPLCAGGGA